jgi:hypothetical protein
MEYRVLTLLLSGICGFETVVGRRYIVISLRRDNRGVFTSRRNMPCTDRCYLQDTLDVPNVKTDVYL